MSDKFVIPHTNANANHPCSDCGTLAIVTLVQSAMIRGRFHYWHLCPKCFIERETDIVESRARRAAKAEAIATEVDTAPRKKSTRARKGGSHE